MIRAIVLSPIDIEAAKLWLSKLHEAIELLDKPIGTVVAKESLASGPMEQDRLRRERQRAQ